MTTREVGRGWKKGRRVEKKIVRERRSGWKKGCTGCLKRGNRQGVAAQINYRFCRFVVSPVALELNY